MFWGGVRGLHDLIKRWVGVWGGVRGLHDSVKRWVGVLGWGDGST